MKSNIIFTLTILALSYGFTNITANTEQNDTSAMQKFFGRYLRGITEGEALLISGCNTNHTEDCKIVEYYFDELEKHDEARYTFKRLNYAIKDSTDEDEKKQCILKKNEFLKSQGITPCDEGWNTCSVIQYLTSPLGYSFFDSKMSDDNRTTFYNALANQVRRTPGITNNDYENILRKIRDSFTNR